MEIELQLTCQRAKQVQLSFSWRMASCPRNYEFTSAAIKHWL